MTAVPYSIRSSWRALAVIPLLGITAVFWAYIFSFVAFKTWYIASAIACTATAILIAAGALRTRGLIREWSFVFLYFLWLLAGMLWAPYPGFTLMWVAIDSIELAVFFLMFLAVRNASPRAVVAAWASLPLAAVATAVLMYRMDPNLSRLANNALPLLPIGVAFTWVGMTRARKRWPYVLLLLLLFAVLVAARSRAPLAGAVGAAGLSMLVFSRNVFDVIKRGIVAGIAAVIVIVALIAIPATRPMTLFTWVRLSGHSVTWGDLYIPAEGYDPGREDINAIAWDVTARTFPLGYGYMNFELEHQRVKGYIMNLHGMYFTWMTEGGLVCLVIVALLFWRTIFRLFRVIRDPVTPDQRDFAKCVLIGTLATMLGGIFHQAHQTPALWALFAMGAAVQQNWREGTE